MSEVKTLSAIIIDDEVMARENLKMMLEDFCPEIKVLDTAENVQIAKQKILEQSPQVIFLDIRMPSGTEGFELLESIPEKNFQVVFVTAFKDYAIQALNVNAIHYILKPIDIEDLQNAVQKLVDYHNLFESSDENRNLYNESIGNLTDHILGKTQQNKITLYHSQGFKIIDLKNIIRMEALSNYTLFYFIDGTEYTDSKTLKFYDELLSNSNFIRIHKSHMINLNHLKEYRSTDGHTAILSDMSEVPISRNRLSEFLTVAKNL